MKKETNSIQRKFGICCCPMPIRIFAKTAIIFIVMFSVVQIIISFLEVGSAGFAIESDETSTQRNPNQENLRKPWSLTALASSPFSPRSSSS